MVHNIMRCAMLAMIACISAACSDHDDLLPGSNALANDSVASNVVLRIALGMPAGGSALNRPQGGEHGDGLEKGLHHENDIHVLQLYSYQGSINGDANTPVKLVAYLTNLDFTPENARIVDDMYVHDVRVDDKFLNGYTFSSADKFIAVTNLMPIGPANLNDLKRAVIGQSLSRVAEGEPMSGCNDFVMSNESESLYTYGIGSPDDPNIITTTVERLAARVDFVTDGAEADPTKQALRYAATDGAEEKQMGSVYVSHARVFNAMKAPSYLLKRLATAEDATPNYLAVEQKPATSLVVDPYTWQKGSTTAAQLESWYGGSRISAAAEAGDAWFRTADKVHTAAPSASNDGFGTSTSTDDEGCHFYVLDYVGENTMPQASTRGSVTTGILLKAVYEPTTVYGDGVDSDGNPVADSHYAYGQTFWRYRPLTPNYSEMQALYFSSFDAADAYRTAHPDEVAEIQEYPAGTCYYPIYLRHDNTEPSADIRMMEFGIVRNNIYRLRVSFTGPGYPSMEGIDKVDPEGIRPYIFVRKWHKINHPEIEI